MYIRFGCNLRFLELFERCWVIRKLCYESVVGIGVGVVTFTRIINSSVTGQTPVTTSTYARTQGTAVVVLGSNTVSTRLPTCVA